LDFFTLFWTCRAGRGGTLSGRELLKGGIEGKSTSLRNEESYSAMTL
jgi:hypothetical protein